MVAYLDVNQVRLVDQNCDAMIGAGPCFRMGKNAHLLRIDSRAKTGVATRTTRTRAAGRTTSMPWFLFRSVYLPCLHQQICAAETRVARADTARPTSPQVISKRGVGRV